MRFPTPQALGGHQNGHKELRGAGGGAKKRKAQGGARERKRKGKKEPGEGAGEGEEEGAPGTGGESTASPGDSSREGRGGGRSQGGEGSGGGGGGGLEASRLGDQRKSGGVVAAPEAGGGNASPGAPGEHPTGLGRQGSAPSRLDSGYTSGYTSGSLLSHAQSDSATAAAMASLASLSGTGGASWSLSSLPRPVGPQAESTSSLPPRASGVPAGGQVAALVPVLSSKGSWGGHAGSGGMDTRAVPESLFAAAAQQARAQAWRSPLALASAQLTASSLPGWIMAAPGEPTNPTAAGPASSASVGAPAAAPGPGQDLALTGQGKEGDVGLLPESGREARGQDEAGGEKECGEKGASSAIDLNLSL